MNQFKRVSRGGLFLLALAVVGVAGVVPAQAQAPAPVFRFAYFDDFPPFSWLEGNKSKGIYMDLIQALMEKELGVPVAFYGLPWARAQAEVREGRADAFITVVNPERLEYTVPVVPVIRGSRPTLYTGAENPDLTKLQGLKTLEEAFQQNLVTYIGDGWSKRFLPAGKALTEVANLNKILPILASNRPIVAIQSDTVLDWLIKSQGYAGKIVKLQAFDPAVTTNLCIGKKSPFADRLKEISAALTRLTDSGKVAALFAAYR